MTKNNQIRINDAQLQLLYVYARDHVAAIVDHYNEKGEPVYIFSEENEILVELFYKLFKEMNKRGLYNA